eukprot:15442013-Alexandrium_andersonii.AAC.1
MSGTEGETAGCATARCATARCPATARSPSPHDRSTGGSARLRLWDRSCDPSSLRARGRRRLGGSARRPRRPTGRRR